MALKGKSCHRTLFQVFLGFSSRCAHLIEELFEWRSVLEALMVTSVCVSQSKGSTPFKGSAGSTSTGFLMSSSRLYKEACWPENRWNVSFKAGSSMEPRRASESSLCKLTPFPMAAFCSGSYGIAWFWLWTFIWSLTTSKRRSSKAPSRTVPAAS